MCRLTLLTAPRLCSWMNAHSLGLAKGSPILAKFVAEAYLIPSDSVPLAVRLILLFSYSFIFFLSFSYYAFVFEWNWFYIYALYRPTLFLLCSTAWRHEEGWSRAYIYTESQAQGRDPLWVRIRWIVNSEEASKIAYLQPSDGRTDNLLWQP